MKHFLIALMVLPGAAIAQVSSYTWPRVTPQQKVYRFPDASSAKIDLPITSNDVKTLYLLQCRADADDANEREFDYSGMFDCRLKDLILGDIDLLHDDLYDGKDWVSRGRFMEEEVWGDCVSYPEWGAVRTFRMRGMDITLSMTNIKFTQSKYPKTGVREAYGGPTPNAVSFNFRVTIKQDAQAVSAQAEPPATTEPVFRLAGQPDKLFRSCSVRKQAHVDGYPAPDSRLSGPFPNVRPVTRRFDVRPGTTSFLFSPAGHDKGGASEESFSIPITDERGRRAYTFRCGPMGGYWLLDWITQCSLSAGGTHTDLLRDAIDPYSRRAMGIVLVDQLQNECQNYPDFGASRTFKLRGMELSLSFTDVKFDPKSKSPGFDDDPGLKSAHLTINVKVDPTAVDPVAVPSPYVWAEFEPSFLKHCSPVYRAEAAGDSLKQ